MSRTALIAVVGLWAGLVLVLAEFRWFRRGGLTERLHRYAPATAGSMRRNGALSAASVAEVVGPLMSAAADRVLSLLGANESLSITLQRLHAPIDAATFRLREAGWVAGSFAVAVLAATALAPPPPLTVLLLAGAPLLAFLVVEQRLSAASAARRQRLFEELPVVTEQLGMLLGAGYSLGAAIGRLGSRGRGAAAEDLRRVSNRIRQGLSEEQALREWSAIADLPEVNRLVDLLALNRHGADLGPLVAGEARAIRREAHRRLLEVIDRRAQLVWIPVTIATLVPGVLFMAIPFIEAMRTFAAL